MTENDRVKEVRKAKDLTMRKFGETLGVGSSTISDIENGRRSLTIHMFKSICREFNVNEEWLRTGQGEMFIPTPDETLKALVAERALSDEDYVLIKKFIELPPAGRQAVIGYIRNVAAELADDAQPTPEQEARAAADEV